MQNFFEDTCSHKNKFGSYTIMRHATMPITLDPNDYARFPELLPILNRKTCFFDSETDGFDGPLICMTFATLENARLTKAWSVYPENYSEERAVLHYMGELVKNYPLFVGYNSIAFDKSHLKRRAVAWGEMQSMGSAFSKLDNGSEMHLDIMRFFKKVKDQLGLPDVRFQTLEQRILGEGRIDDLDPQEFGKYYFEYTMRTHAKEKHIPIDMALWRKCRTEAKRQSTPANNEQVGALYEKEKGRYRIEFRPGEALSSSEAEIADRRMWKILSHNALDVINMVRLLEVIPSKL